MKVKQPDISFHYPSFAAGIAMFHPSAPKSQSVIKLSRRKPPLDRRLAVTREAQAQLLELYAGGVETRSLAERFGVQENYIRKLASRNGVRKGQCADSPAPRPKSRPVPIRNHHIAAYKKARRGFDVPSELEPAYTQLLIGGLSRHAAARHLGLLLPRPIKSGNNSTRCHGTS
jgi:hypothetical protein